jgi:hypothetical protein
MSRNILSGYHLNFNFTLVPIGSRYWITNAKVGSRYLTHFQNENEPVQKVQISVCTDANEVETPGSIIIDLHGVKCRISLTDGEHNQLDVNFTYTQFKSMMNRCSLWIIRNPLERFKSGTIQKITEFYHEMRNAYMDRPNSDWESVFFLPNRALHKDYPIDWSFFFENYPQPTETQDVGRNNKWFQIWKQFCEYFFLDLSRYSDMAHSFSGDIHTQPYLYHLRLFFDEIGLLNKLTIIDIDELDLREDLFENEIGKVRYRKILNELNLEYSKTSTGEERTAKDVKNFLRETLGRFKNVNYKSIEDFFIKSETYRWEMVIYLMLLDGRVPTKRNLL